MDPPLTLAAPSGVSGAVRPQRTPTMAPNPSVPMLGEPAFGVGGGVLLLGKLMRRDRRFLTWKWRDFILERNRLQYFSEKGFRKGDIMITPTTPITIRLTSEPKPFGFLLFIKDEKLTLAAQNEMERRKWIDVFCDVFHASVEQAPPDNKAERRARPTFLPIPDISTSGSSHSLSLSQNGSMSSMTGSSNKLLPTGSPEMEKMNSATGVDMDVIPILESRMTYGPLKEMYSRITFPPSLANGDLLVGVGPIVRRMGWTDERILAVGMYIDPEVAAKELAKFHGRSPKSLYGDQLFYDFMIQKTTFRRSFVFTARKRVSKSVITALLHDELGPRLGPDSAAVQTFLGFIEKSLKKAESTVLRIHEDGRFEYRHRGQLYPPIASHALCKGVQAMFFDSNSIQHDAKRSLIDRLPSLWGGEILDAQDEIFGSMNEKQISDDDDDSDDDLFDDDDDFEVFSEKNDDEVEAYENEDAFDGDEHDHSNGEEHDGSDNGEHDNGEHGSSDELEKDEHGDRVSDILRKSTMKPRSSRLSGYRSSTSRRSTHSAPRRTLSTKEELDEQDEQEHELMRRESRNLVANFGPLLDPDTNAVFTGDLLVDGSALLGTWSQKMAVSPEQFDTPYDGHSHRLTIGLYVDPGAASEDLLKYKGLSVGSILQDPDFFVRFARGPFVKHLVIKVDSKVSLTDVLDYFDSCLQLTVSTADEETSKPESLRASWTEKATERFQKQAMMLPKDEIRLTIGPHGDMSMTVKHRGSASISSTSSDMSSRKNTIGSTDEVAKGSSSEAKRADSDASTNSSFITDETIMLPPPPFHLRFQSILYGFHARHSTSSAQLMQRLPNLLDLAKDDLVHTYHDEIQVLKENYKRQRPENRVKVGYLSISFEKTKKLRSAETGVKEPTVVASRWSKRWCRLDGTLFSYYSHKRSRKYRDMMDLTRCEVIEVTSTSGTELARFAWGKGENDSIRIAIVKPNGEIIALRTESIYEGEEWLESLTEASRVRRLSDASLGLVSTGATIGLGNPWDSSIARLRRRSSAAVPALVRGASTSNLIPGNTANLGVGTRDLLTAADGGRGSDAQQSVHRLSTAGNLGLDDGETDAGVEKEGSLVAWVQEDPRHAVITVLLAVIVWLVTARHTARFLEVELP